MATQDERDQIRLEKPHTAAEYEICFQKMMKYQAEINDQIKKAFDTIMSLGNQMNTDFWDDYLHSPEDINGRSTDERWNKNTLRLMQNDIEDSM